MQLAGCVPASPRKVHTVEAWTFEFKKVVGLGFGGRYVQDRSPQKIFTKFWRTSAKCRIHRCH